MTQFSFLSPFPAVAEAAGQAESLAKSDPRTSCFHTRRALELALQWAYKHDARLSLPYAENLSALIHESTFQAVAGRAVFTKCRVVTRLGNAAVHGAGAVTVDDAVAAVRELWHVSWWLASTYSPEPPGVPLVFSSRELPEATGGGASPKTADELAALQDELAARDERLREVLDAKDGLDAELKQLRAEIATVRAANEAAPAIEHDYNEAQTRDTFIDLLLKEAGWALDQARDREYEVQGMPNNRGIGYCDYVLWGQDGKPLAVVEAKRTKRSPREGQRQAELYADCLEKMHGRRPIIYTTNGYEHWIWDDHPAAGYPPRPVQGFHTRSELELMVQRRTARRSLAKAAIPEAIAGRPYQVRAIRRVGEAFETDKRRKTLLVMATGTGKTRATIALADVLMKANWAKRVLFLADRVALVNQAVGAFKTHLPEAATVNLVKERDADGRIYCSTYPTIMNLIDEVKGGERRFGVGHFDLVVIDEAHRSVFRKYRHIFDYFDAHLLGLTATPKDEVDRNTYGLFDLEDGVPTDAYGLEEAIQDGYLVPPKSIGVPVKFVREGLKYADLSDEEKAEWETLPWDEEEGTPGEVNAAAINKRLFNKNTVDQVLAHLMTNGQTVEGGDKLAKTILFAKNQKHAEFIEERFNANYPHLAGKFARIITFQTEYAQSLIDAFGQKDKEPTLAISVDMLDTGIDVPEVCNLVFFKMVRSKTKFWQMIGRGTRLCPNLFGPGQDKESFTVFDYCANLDYFSEDLPDAGEKAALSLKERLFGARLELIQDVDRQLLTGINDHDGLRSDLAATLHAEVAAMNLDNFIVRPQRKLVETYSQQEAWNRIDREQALELAQHVAPLPTELPGEKEDAKRFDLLMLTLQLATLRDDPKGQRLQKKVQAIANELEELRNIPDVAKELELILDLQSDEWWQDATVPMLDDVRRRLRTLIHLIEHRVKAPLYTDFQDEIGMETLYELPGTANANGLERFRQKIRHELRAMDDDPVVQSLRRGEPPSDDHIPHLERLLTELAPSRDLVDQVRQEPEGIAGFIQGLVGLDRQAAQAPFAAFLAKHQLNGKQIQFMERIIDYVCEHGTIEAKVLFESPFVELAPTGLQSLFASEQVAEILTCVQNVRA